MDPKETRSGNEVKNSIDKTLDPDSVPDPEKILGEDIHFELEETCS